MMTLRNSIKYPASLVLMLATAAMAQAPLGSTITYQGQLKQSNSPANGSFMMTFKLWNDATLSAPGNQVGPTLVFDGGSGGGAQHPPPVSVANGLFTVQLDFGTSAYNGERRWLEIAVNGNTLSPRQELTAAPHARFSTAPWATSSSNISNTNSGNVGIGTASPGQKLSVVGTVESTSGGFKFPDGTTQTSAASSVGTPTNLISAWGLNSDGQIIAPAGDFIAVGAGEYHSFGIRPGGTVVGWGANFDGQIDVPAGTYTAVTGGYDFSIGLRTDGTLAGWGYNGPPINVPAGTFTAIAAGDEFGVAIRTNGTLAGWGYNSGGETNVPAGTYIAVAAGVSHGLAIRSDGTLVGWGQNSDGQINVPAGTFTAIAAGGYHSLAVRSDGTLLAWGYNSSGQIDVPPGTYTDAKAGYAHSIARRTDGTLVGFGEDYSGQIDVPGGSCLSFACGDSHTLAICPGIALNESLSTTVASINGTLSVSGAASFAASANFSGPIDATGAATFRDDVSVWQDCKVFGRLGVSESSPSSSIEAFGGIRARQGAPGASGSSNNGFSFGINSDKTTGMYSLANGQLNFYTGASERLRIDSSGNVGLGITTPACRLHIVGGADSSLAGGGYIQTGNTFGENISIDSNEMMARNNGSPSALFFNHEGGNVIIADTAAGNLGVGTASPSQRLHVIGNICATGSIGGCSDARYKTNVDPLVGALSLVEKLRPVRFNWRSKEFPDRQFNDERQIGLIAQEVRKIAPEVVQEGSDGYLSVDYGRLTPVLVEAMKEQQAQVDQLQKENVELRARLDRLESAVSTPLSKGGSR